MEPKKVEYLRGLSDDEVIAIRSVFARPEALSAIRKIFLRQIDETAPISTFGGNFLSIKYEELRMMQDTDIAAEFRGQHRAFQIVEQGLQTLFMMSVQFRSPDATVADAETVRRKPEVDDKV